MATPTIGTNGNGGIQGDYFVYYDEAAGERRAIKGVVVQSGVTAPFIAARVNGQDFEYVDDAQDRRSIGGAQALGGGNQGVVGVRSTRLAWDDGSSFYAAGGDLDFIKSGPTLTLTDRDCDVLVDTTVSQTPTSYLPTQLDLYRDPDNDPDQTFDLYKQGIPEGGWADTNVTDGVTYSYFVRFTLTDSKGNVLTADSPTKSLTWTDNCGGGGPGPGSPSLDSFSASGGSGSASFTASYSDLTGSETAEVDWGDGTTETYSSPPSTDSYSGYSFAGDFTVALRLYDDQGNQIDSDSDTATVT
jgi:hypothetical protein